MKRIFLTVQYDGANYNGWQKQKDGTSIQGEIESAVFEVTGEIVDVEGSGRTDAGVSAIAQVAHFDTESKIDAKRFAKALNTKLPDDISVLESKECKKHARFDVKKKTYIYQLYTSETRQPIIERTMGRVSFNLDIDKMKEEAKSFVGTHNFKSFCSTETQAKEFVRTIYEFKVSRHGELYWFEVTGSGFLYNMVRIMVGTLVEIGMGKDLKIAEIIKAENRTKAGKTMPAHGLMLKKVVY